MPWPMRLFDSRDAVEAQYGYPLPVGAMWPAPWMLDDDGGRDMLSPEYLAQRAAVRFPLWVQLPGGAAFCVDSRATTTGEGWTVTGEAPCITVSPSVNAIGMYHGYIRDGVITDDCEGRTFPNERSL